MAFALAKLSSSGNARALCSIRVSVLSVGVGHKRPKDKTALNMMTLMPYLESGSSIASASAPAARLDLDDDQLVDSHRQVLDRCLINESVFSSHFAGCKKKKTVTLDERLPQTLENARFASG